MSPEQIKELINASLTSAFTSMCMFGRSISTFSALHSSSTFPSSITSSAWVLDFGASNHMTAIAQNLTHTKPYDGNEHITAANDHHLPISGIGSLEFTTPQQCSLKLSNVYFVPNLSANRISVGQLVDSGYLV